MDNFLQHNFSGKKVLVRVDYNVPLDDKMQITDDNRIRASIPTIRKIMDDGGKVILMSHLGRPKDGPTEKYSLKHLVPHLSKLLNTNVKFVNDCVGDQVKKTVDQLQPGQVLLLENLRFYKEEEKGDPVFAKKLALLADIYVNDAFGTAHRAHASTAVIAHEFPGSAKMFGLVMEGEVKSAEKVLHSAESPFTAILGGAKVSDKILLIENLLKIANHIIIGGGMSYTFFKATGGHIGNSLVEEDRIAT
ncbi:MAG TPA: phosphoglycerate kinase, partial [Flavitalea sp.]|nr:phosphoglycerate kinase [Flavitalea sp.]